MSVRQGGTTALASACLVRPWERRSGYLCPLIGWIYAHIAPGPEPSVKADAPDSFTVQPPVQAVVLVTVQRPCLGACERTAHLHPIDVGATCRSEPWSALQRGGKGA